MKETIMKTPDQTNRKINRREFLKTLAASGGAAAVAAVLAGCGSTVPTGSGVISSTGITLDLTKPGNQSLAAVGGALALEANSLDSKGMLLFRKDESTVLAFSRKCTHLGCTVGEFQNGVAACPCHGSQFDTGGNVVNGPASSALKSYPATLSGSMVTIGG
jgi:cytochrome b6-f complex iron-sulfur subunit